MNPTPFFRLPHQDTTPQFRTNVKNQLTFPNLYFHVFYTILTHAVARIVTNL